MVKVDPATGHPIRVLFHENTGNGVFYRFFASDPLTRARALAAIYPKGEAMQRVLDFLQREENTP